MTKTLEYRLRRGIKCYCFVLLLAGLLAACGGGGNETDSGGGASVNITGRWSGSVEVSAGILSCSGAISMNFSQELNSANVSGDLSADCSGIQVSNTFSGTISGNSVMLTDNDGDTYQLILNGNQLSGTISNPNISGSGSLEVTRV